MSEKKIIIANWKENPESLDTGKKLIDISERYLATNNNQPLEVTILHAVPSIFAETLSIYSKKTNIILQNISEYEGGSHTGEISVKQMLNCKIQSSLVGHSETRISPRNPKGDENLQINKKIQNLLKAGAGFVLCVGEYERNTEGGWEIIKQQLEENLDGLSAENIEANPIAYEPVWAIGEKAESVASEQEISENILTIKNFVKEKWGAKVQVLYGGSVEENNARKILELELVDGLLIGRASSDPTRWENLLKNILGEAKITDSNLPEFKYQTVSDLKLQPNDKVILRLDLNVPINNQNEILNAFRIEESLSTIELLQKTQTKTVIIAHKEKGDLQVVADYLQKKIQNFSFLPFTENEKLAQTIDHLQGGQVLLMDNLRLDEREKKNDQGFAKYLASLGNYYINEAFSASHREHASIIGIPKILGAQKCALGPQFVKEIEKLRLALTPTYPALLIIGGAKFDTKLKMLERFLKVVDFIFVGGALAHNFWKQKYNYNLGRSLLDEEIVLSAELLENQKILLPLDVMVESREVKEPKEIDSTERIVDFGPKSLEKIVQLAEKCQTIIWNGPLGYYEGGYESGTKNLLLALNQIQKKSPEKTIILGGGDTVTEIDKLNEELINTGKEKLNFTHISTGGGAMIDFLANGTLPGINALNLQN